MDYLDGFQYENGVLKFFPTAEGYFDAETGKYVYHYTDHLGNVRVSYMNSDGLGTVSIVDESNYYPFGLKHEGYNAMAGNPSYMYKYNGKELQETGMYDYGARFYMPDIGRWGVVDPLAEHYRRHSTYNYAVNNPIRFIDPDGRGAESTDVRQNKNGTYTVVNAKDDGDNNVYVVNDKGKRTGEIVAQTMTPHDFMMTNDSTGELYFDKKANGVTFDLNNLGITAEVDGNTIINGDANALLQWGKSIYRNALSGNDVNSDENALALLANMSRNGAVLDLKVSLHLNKYTPVQNGTTPDGKPILTTLRAMGNMVFGTNMNIAQNYSNRTEMSFYQSTMPVVGAYNQWQNNRQNFLDGKGYNPGFPYYGEHSYSGGYIYMGYFKHFYKK